MRYVRSGPIRLQAGATVAIIGGGPAGAFMAMHLLREAARRRHRLRVVIFEYRRRTPGVCRAAEADTYSGCPQCAGGLSPRLNDALGTLEVYLPPGVVQARVHSIVVQGNWKHIVLAVPADRRMLSVYRGVLPFGQHIPKHSFDLVLLNEAVNRGAELIPCRVEQVRYDDTGRPALSYRNGAGERELRADFAVFAGGVNESEGKKTSTGTPVGLFRALVPQYRPPAVRKALIFELEADGAHSGAAEGEMHYIEASAGDLHLDMCSIIPKSGFFTVSLIGRSVDRTNTHREHLAVIRAFLDLPQIRRSLSDAAPLRVRCICNPRIVVGAAANPFGSRTAAIGDMATARQYKDGILSAFAMARDLAAVAFERGIDLRSLRRGYGATLSRFRQDNRYATVIFNLYRRFFTSPFLSRAIYHTYTGELKYRPEAERRFTRIFWNISSGDQSYRRIARDMLAPGTVWQILASGVYVTARNWMGERLFGLRWGGMGRYPTAVAREELEAIRRRLLDGRCHEFECIYTIQLRVNPEAALAAVGQFGEASRAYLNPRWVAIRRSAGRPLQAGCRIDYRVFGGLVRFSIEQTSGVENGLVRYRVHGGFADGGNFIFEVRPHGSGQSRLTVYLTFDYARGHSLIGRCYCAAFRLCFPEFIHDVLWNHALCELKQAVETVDLQSEPELIPLQHL